MLSGGGQAGCFHLGLVISLVKHNLLPKVITGSSSGSIMAAYIATKTKEELNHLIDTKFIKIFDSLNTTPSNIL